MTISMVLFRITEHIFPGRKKSPHMQAFLFCILGMSEFSDFLHPADTEIKGRTQLAILLAISPNSLAISRKIFPIPEVPIQRKKG